MGAIMGLGIFLFLVFTVGHAVFIVIKMIICNRRRGQHGKL